MAEILVVDDSEASVEVMAHYLEAAAGHHATTARSGAEAERLMAMRGFDLLMFDFKISDRDGLELSQWARARDIRTPIILCSAIDENDLKDVADQMTRDHLGPVAVFSKTSNPPSGILDLIEKLTNQEATKTYR